MTKLLNSGFEYISMLITISILAMLSLFAFNSYRDYLIRFNRIAISAYLLKQVNLLEQYFAENGTYLCRKPNTNFCKSPGNYPEIRLDLNNIRQRHGYNINYWLEDGPHGNSFYLVAIPLAGSIQEAEQHICVNHSGQITYHPTENCLTY